MRRLPIALVLAAAIALMVTVPIRYVPLPVNETFEYVCHYGGITSTSVIVWANVNVSKIPPVIFIKSNVTISDYYLYAYGYETETYYYQLAEIINGTILVFKLVNVPKYVEPFIETIDFSFYVARTPAAFYISTDGVNWVRVPRC